MKKSKQYSQDKACVHQDHPSPITRRQFISAGLMTGVGYAMVPGIATLLAREVFAADPTCPVAGASPGLLPFVLIDCSGGAGLSGNFVVGGPGGSEDLLKTSTGALNYNTLGVPPSLTASSPNLFDNQFGAPLWNGVGAGGVPPATATNVGGVSQLRAGMLSVMSATTRANTSMMTICATSQDDTSINPLSPLILVTKAGYRGNVISSGIGNVAGSSGGKSISPITDLTAKPLFVGSPLTIPNALSFGGAIKNLSAARKVSMMRSLASLNDRQKSRLAQFNQGDQLSFLAKCAYEKNISYADGSAGPVDARQDAIMRSLWNITATSNDENSVRASLAYGALKNITGPACITIPGCDYHNRDRIAVTDPRDFDIGRELGRVLEAAAQMGKGVVVAGISDGSVVSSTTPDGNGMLQWVGDSGSRGLAWIACYKPAGKPQLTKTQLGNFTSGQAANRSLFFGQNPSQVAYIILANYLKLSGLDPAVAMPKVIPLGAFPMDQLNSILAFG